MSRLLPILVFGSFAFLPVTHAQESQPVPATSASTQAHTGGRNHRRAATAAKNPTVPAATVPASAPAYYPPPGSLQAPLTAADVCRSLRGGLSGVEVAQDVRERGLTGSFGEDEAADARAAGAVPDFVAALQAGHFTVSSAYVQRYAEPAAKGQRAAESNAWRAEAAARAQANERENELRRQGQLAAENNRAIATKEREDRQRFENMQDKADRESRQQQSYNANNGYWHEGRWYLHRYGSRGHYIYN